MRNTSVATGSAGSGGSGVAPTPARKTAGTQTAKLAWIAAGALSSGNSASATRIAPSSVCRVATGSQVSMVLKTCCRAAPSACVTPARESPWPAKLSHNSATVPSKPNCPTRSGIGRPRTQSIPPCWSAWLSTVSATTTPSRPGRKLEVTSLRCLLRACARMDRGPHARWRRRHVDVFDAERLERIEDSADHRGRRGVVLEAAGQQLAVFVKDNCFHQRLADALRHAAVDLAFA